MMYGEVGYCHCSLELSKGIITRELLRDVVMKEAAEVVVVIKSRKTGPSGFQALLFVFWAACDRVYLQIEQMSLPFTFG